DTARSFTLRNANGLKRSRISIVSGSRRALTHSALSESRAGPVDRSLCGNDGAVAEALERLSLAPRSLLDATRRPRRRNSRTDATAPADRTAFTGDPGATLESNFISAQLRFRSLCVRRVASSPGPSLGALKPKGTRKAEPGISLSRAG